jgi:hypothetical protein
MFLRATIRHRDVKPHRCYSAVESGRAAGRRVMHWRRLYLGEIDSS